MGCLYRWQEDIQIIVINARILRLLDGMKTLTLQDICQL